MGEVRKIEKILSATENLFASHRYHEVTLEKISRRAGVGKGTIYLYFKNKEDLYYQTVIKGLDKLIVSLQRYASSKDEDAGRLLLKLSGMIHGFFLSRRGLFALLRSEELRSSNGRQKFHHKWHKRRKAMTEIFAEVIRLGIKEGRYEKHLDPALTASLFLGMLSFGFRQSQRGGRSRDPVRLAVNILEKGIQRKS